MKKRTKLIAGIGSVALIACVAMVVLYVLRDPVNQSACAKIQEGMTETEVLAILGRPCDTVSRFTVKKIVPSADGMMRKIMQHRAYKTWQGPAGRLMVAFEEAGCVADVSFQEDEKSILMRVRRMLGLVDEEPLQLPTPFYLNHPPQYIPPSPPVELNTPDDLPPDGRTDP